MRRREVADRIKEARGFGDTSENSADLSDKLRSARPINSADVSTAAVTIGVTVHVKDQKPEKSNKFRIVGSAEASPTYRKLSNESPVSKALMGGPFSVLTVVPG